MIYTYICTFVHHQSNFFVCIIIYYLLIGNLKKNKRGIVTGLLSHMEHMRMDPKHQFAAQYVLSRAAAERRERESLIAAAVAASNAGNFGIGGG